VVNNKIIIIIIICRSQSPSGLRRRSAAPRPLRLCVRIPPGEWMFVCWEYCVLSGIRFCDGLITRPEESYRLWCVVVCDLEPSWMRRPWPTGGGGAVAPKRDRPWFGKRRLTLRITVVILSTVLFNIKIFAFFHSICLYIWCYSLKRTVYVYISGVIL
jgi:hypothetical protein